MTKQSNNNPNKNPNIHPNNQPNSQPNSQPNKQPNSQSKTQPNTQSTQITKIGNYQVEEIKDINEIQCQLWRLTHLPTGAQILHLANNDEENAFCLSFQTIPKTSDGVAHILEHTVLCGSEKFPVKDPFFCMTRRSLNTFMNAFTGADFTCYPAATQVPKDFYNLLEVYCDAVFKPKLRELSFMQEGHHLEFATPDDPTTPLTYHGVVFNEMKGALVTADSRLEEEINASLYPTLTYGVNSGGDPKVIPELTYQGLIDFHKTYYHPSRCIFYFYGNIPLEKHLDFLEKNVFKGISKAPPLPSFTRETRLKSPIRKVITYPFSKEENPKDKSLISFNWLTCNILEQEELAALTILTTAILTTDAAPLKKALLRSKLCKQVSTHLNDENSEIPLSITLRGCDLENCDKLETLIRTKLEEIASEGIPADLIDNAIHQLEFQRCEITGDGLPYGLSLFFRSALLMQHKVNPEDGLTVHTLCKRLREKTPQYYIDLMRKHLIDNPHFVRIAAIPDVDLEAKERAAETEQLAKLKAGLTKSEMANIVKKAAELATFQEEQENAEVDVLPTVTLQDVPKTTKEYELQKETFGPLTLFHHDTFTNGIVYAKIVFPLPKISEANLPLVRLFSMLMPQMGSGGRNYVDTLNYIQAHTGGVACSENLNIQAVNFENFAPYFSITGKALYRKVDKFFSLIKDMISSTDFTDIERLREVITKHATGLRANFNNRALKYAIKLSQSQLDVPSRINNAWGGLEFYHYLCDLADHFDERGPQFVKELQSMQEQMLGLKGAHLIITCDQVMYDKLKQENFYGLKDIPARTFTPWDGDYSVEPIPSQGRTIPTPVAFSAKSFKTIPYVHPDSPALGVAANLFSNLTLHPKIREQGGAYGGGASSSSIDGSFTFYAYRDPNIASTFEAFNESITRILSGDFTDRDLEEAKLEIVQELDDPVSPGSRGGYAYALYRSGETAKMRQDFRERLLSLGKGDIIEAVQKHIVTQMTEGAAVIFAGKELLEKENGRLSSPVQIRGL